MPAKRLSAAQRAKKVGDQTQKELSDILRHLRDPRIPPLTVMKVDTARDMSVAKVYVTSLGLDDIDGTAVEKALEKASGYIRSELGQRLSTYTVPKLLFFYDRSVEEGIKLSLLIDQALANTVRDDE